LGFLLRSYNLHIMRVVLGKKNVLNNELLKYFSFADDIAIMAYTFAGLRNY
jgi:hypothetical protein